MEKMEKPTTISIMCKAHFPTHYPEKGINLSNLFVELKENGNGFVVKYDTEKNPTYLFLKSPGLNISLNKSGAMLIFLNPKQETDLDKVLNCLWNEHIKKNTSRFF